MADNYLGNKMEAHLAGRDQRPAKPVRSFNQLLEENRSQRRFDHKVKVSYEQLGRIVAVNTKIPSARNQQVLRFRLVTGQEAQQVTGCIRLGGAHPEWGLPDQETCPEAYIVMCTTVERDHYVDIDLGISAQSMLLKAVDMGLNGICIGAFDKERLKNALGLTLEPLLVLAIGKGLDKVRLREITPDKSRQYYREEGCHIVPKIGLEHLIIK